LFAASTGDSSSSSWRKHIGIKKIPRLAYPSSQLKKTCSAIKLNPLRLILLPFFLRLAGIRPQAGEGHSGHPAQVILPPTPFSRIRASSILIVWTSGPW
jgi:hypothetical protein